VSTKVVAITGAARGIGLATAQALAQRGHRVLIGDLDAGEAQQAAAALPGTASHSGHALDVTDEASFRAFLDAAGPRIDVLVNNAGIMVVGPLEGAGYRGASKVIDVNVKGVAIGMHLAVPRMRASGSGHIVNVISSSAWIAPPALAVYSAIKHAARGLTDAVRGEVRGAGIRVTGVYPGVVQTDLAVGTKASRGAKMIEPGEVAEAIAGAIEKPRAELFVPRSLGPVLRTYQALPPRVRRAFSRAAGLDDLYTEVDPQTRADYERRIAGG
jgi:NAD(P)-dependent dehydrogenase (short-subunit alcohol dehydrogenase family)